MGENQCNSIIILNSVIFGFNMQNFQAFFPTLFYPYTIKSIALSTTATAEVRGTREKGLHNESMDTTL